MVPSFGDILSRSSAARRGDTFVTQTAPLHACEKVVVYEALHRFDARGSARFMRRWR